MHRKMPHVIYPLDIPNDHHDHFVNTAVYLVVVKAVLKEEQESSYLQARALKGTQMILK